MNNAAALLAGLLLAQSLVLPAAAHAPIEDTSATLKEPKDEVLERTLQVRGTEYQLRVNTSNHTVSVFAEHLAANETNARYAVSLDNQIVINQGWNASEGETSRSQANLIYQYDATERVRNITLSTFYGSTSLSYNFTVPRTYEGRYLRPTVTDVDLNQINESHGRVTVTVRSDSKYYYPVYFQIWAPGVQGKYLQAIRENGENVTTASIIVPVEEGDVFEGELKAHTGWLNESGPLHAQWEYYGHPGQEQFDRVPFEPMDIEKIDDYSYRNESRDAQRPEDSVLSEQYRTIIGGVAAASFVLIVVAVLVAQRRRT
ncbi:hypothetical protein G9C85_00305 [Halorubellus sp. JP-L1]|uniref:hypothetical protein n=1 Tax=Halorubellus sp. JP-L1 TaxID=2715753 RepID=UPI00140D79A0|nr:hypothetical protein [Halorubellus sp. JP-L1]NHN40080.1 hypothetical protein [Halorubellus sp. JP-L1]